MTGILAEINKKRKSVKASRAVSDDMNESFSLSDSEKREDKKGGKLNRALTKKIMQKTASKRKQYHKRNSIFFRSDF